MSELLVNTIKKADGTGSLTVPAESGTVVVKDGSNDVTLNNITATGVYLGGTGAANYLDDYEEGTFDVLINGVDSGLDGYYTKIGSVVTVHIDVTATASANGSSISLPFATNSNKHGAIAVGWQSTATAKSAYVDQSTNTIVLTVDQGTSSSSLLNGERVIMGGSYLTNF